jgi:aspartate aminotransferase
MVGMPITWGSMSEEIKFSRRVISVKPSTTLAISARAGELRKQGKDIASLSVGEPDFKVPSHVEAAVKVALEKGLTRYTPSSGLPELREAIAAFTKREAGVTVTAAQVQATAGAKQALYNACQALLDEGDEAVIPNPYWVSYPDMVKLAGAKPVELKMSAGTNWQPTGDALAKVMTDKTRVVILGSPSNPTGSVWGERSLKEVAAVLEKFPRAVILSDDIYSKLVYGGVTAPHLLTFAPGLAARTVIIHGCSKSYAMTGLRLGWAVGPKEIISAMNKVQDSSTSNPSSLSQHAAIAALNGPQGPVEEMRASFERRRDYMLGLLAKVPGVKTGKPDGAFYVFPDVSFALGKKHKGVVIDGTVKLSEMLLEEYGVAVVPGSAFGAEGYLRLSFATADAEIAKGVERLAQGLAALE